MTEIEQLQEDVAALKKKLNIFLTMRNQSSGERFLTERDILATVSAASKGQLFVSDLTVTNNSPGAGSVAWTAFTVFYNGVEYAVSSGNTSDKYIWWNLGDAALSTGSTYTPQAGRFLILVNNGGTYDEAWNKIASEGVVRDHMGFLLSDGFYQPAALASASVDTQAVATTTIVDVSGQGALLSVGLYGTGFNPAPGALPIIDIEWNIDGQGYQALRVWDGTSQVLFPGATVAVSSVVNQGAVGVAGGYISFVISLPYSSSLKVRANVSQAAAGGTVPQNVTVAVLRASKI